MAPPGVSKGEIFNSLNEILAFTKRNRMKSDHYNFLYYKVDTFLNNS